MKPLTEKNRAMWDLLFTTGERLTAAEVAGIVGIESMDAFWGLQNMARRGLIKTQPHSKTRYLTYSVDGMCMVPRGMRLAEVQA